MASITISDLHPADLYRTMTDEETEQVSGGRLIIGGEVLIDWHWPEHMRIDFIF